MVIDTVSAIGKEYTVCGGVPHSGCALRAYQESKAGEEGGGSVTGGKCRHASCGREGFSVCVFSFSSFSSFSAMGTDEINAEMKTKNT